MTPTWRPLVCPREVHVLPSLGRLATCRMWQSVFFFVTLLVNGPHEDNPVPCRWGGSLYFPVCNDTHRLWWLQCGIQSVATLVSFVLVKTNLVQAAVAAILCIGVCKDTRQRLWTPTSLLWF